MMPNRESQEAYLRKLAKRNVCDGILYEPRVYHDAFVIPSGERMVQANPDTFRNGEQWPVRIRFITAIMGRADQVSPALTPAPGDERLIQRYGFRIIGHDTDYMGANFIPLPHWHNRRVGAAPSMGRGISVWQFDHAVPLGQRDSFVASVQLLSALVLNTARGVTLGFTGIGRASRRPYLLSSRKRLVDQISTQFEIDDFRNDGDEVIDLTQLSLFVESEEDSSNPAGDVQEAAIQIQQTGNGTNHRWCITDPTAANQLAPAGLFGVDMGRAVVHELPGDGWVWNPGQGLTPQVLNIDTDRASEETVHIAMLGHAIIT